VTENTEAEQWLLWVDKIMLPEFVKLPV